MDTTIIQFLCPASRLRGTSFFETNEMRQKSGICIKTLHGIVNWVEVNLQSWSNAVVSCILWDYEESFSKHHLGWI